MNKFLNNPQDRPFHSSGLARVAHGDAIGAASQQTFSQRTHVDRNRQVVNHYRESMVARGDLGSPATRRSGQRIDIVKPYNRDRRSIRGMNNPGAASGVQPPAPSFIEPTSRGYNPYG